MDLPEGELAWSTERPKDAKMCIPAAFTDLEGNVEGEYRLNGKIFNPTEYRDDSGREVTGLKLVRSLTSSIEYNRVLGFNVTVVTVNR